MAFFAALAGPVIGALIGGHSGGTPGSGQPTYNPLGTSQADYSWLNANNGSNAVSGAAASALPYYTQGFNNLQGISYYPTIPMAGDVGRLQANASDVAGQQARGYGSQAQTMLGQQGQLLNAGNQIYQTAFDPQNALYDRSYAQMLNQTRAGQAARGLGNSDTGQMEEQQAGRDFNTAWQNAQLSRQAQGITSMDAANQTGINLGSAYGRANDAQLGAYGQQGSLAMQSALTPIQAQQWAYGQPGAAASQYQQQLLGLQQMYGNVQSQSLPYMNFGNGATTANYNAGVQQNQQQANALGQIAGGAVKQFGPVSSWFGGSPTSYDMYGGSNGALMSMYGNGVQ